jgi:GTP cyclohydrolase IA
MRHELALESAELTPPLAQQVSGIALPSRPELRIASDGAGVDLAAAERAAADFLAALGIEVDRAGLRETPARMARVYAELFDVRPLQLTTFPNDEGYDELVLVRAIPFGTVCEHHLLPFSGVAHIGYLPGERILGLSKLAASSSISRPGRRPRSG